jgi:hypothetical protein
VATRKASSGSDKNASDFIRAQATSTTAPEVVEAGKKAGFDFSTSLVYAVRGRMKKSPAAGSGKREAAAAPRRASVAPALGGGRLDAQIQGLVEAFVKEMSTLVRRAALDSVRQALGERD